ncbi:hypothetical protein BV25DRAFT_1462868 [Artomyces pyxidatus]|nr:hypothetical protein BV25DRAFT_1462868 [Artomyces pyxidatus]
MQIYIGAKLLEISAGSSIGGTRLGRHNDKHHGDSLPTATRQAGLPPALLSNSFDLGDLQTQLFVCASMSRNPYLRQAESSSNQNPRPRSRAQTTPVACGKRPQTPEDRNMLTPSQSFPPSRMSREQQTHYPARGRHHAST